MIAHTRPYIATAPLCGKPRNKKEIEGQKNLALSFPQSSLLVFLCFSLFVFLAFWLYVFLTFCLFVFLSFGLFVLSSFCPFVLLSFCLFVFLYLCLFVWTSCWSNVWRISSLKSHYLCQNSKVALSYSARVGIELPGQLKKVTCKSALWG